MQNAQAPFYLIALMGGIAVPILATLNAALGQALGSPQWASLILCAVAFSSVLVVALVAGSPFPTGVALSDAPWWAFFGGCFFMIYVVSITYVAPKIGIGNAIIFVVVAQIFTAITIDHFGLLGAAVQPMDWKRALGVVFLVIGIALSRSQTVTPGTGG